MKRVLSRVGQRVARAVAQSERGLATAARVGCTTLLHQTLPKAASAPAGRILPLARLYSQAAAAAEASPNVNEGFVTQARTNEGKGGPLNENQLES